MAENTEPTDAPSVTEQPPFVPEAGSVPVSVPAARTGLPPTAQAFFAVVDALGTLVRGFQAVSATRLFTGGYQVLFSHDVTGSAYIATPGLPGSGAILGTGQITVASRSGAPHGVLVQTFDPSGNPIDLSFHLAILS